MFIIGIVIVFGLVVPAEDTQLEIDVLATLFLRKCVQFCSEHKFHNLVRCQWNKGVPTFVSTGQCASDKGDNNRSTRSHTAL